MPDPGETTDTHCDVAYEDDDVLVVVKPAGMVMHPAYRHADGTLWDLLVRMFAARGILERPRLLHRLDRATSGLVCVPKHLAAHRVLERRLRGGQFRKEYLALVLGQVYGAGTITVPLARDPDDQRRVTARPDGQAALTHYTPLLRGEGFSLLRVRIETGRTHQIRVHLAYSGHPVVGDLVYGDPAVLAERLQLHADRLTFPRPSGTGTISCRASLPPEFRRALPALRRRGAA